MAFLIVLTIALYIPHGIQCFYHRGSTINEFKDYLKLFRKKYSNENFNKHLKIFKANVVSFQTLNTPGSVVYGYTPFTDMDLETFSGKYDGYDKTLMDVEGEKYIPSGKPPDELDWRDTIRMNPASMQEGCRNSYLISAIGNIEAQYARKHKDFCGQLSLQQGYDCEFSGTCETGGVPHYVMKAIHVEGGSMFESDYPYSLNYSTNKNSCATDRRKIKVKFDTVKHLRVGGEDDLKNAVANLGPLVTTMHIPPLLQHYKRGVFDPVDCDKPTNHAVLVVGYGGDGENGTPYWIIKNSWGERWGDYGYLRLIRGKKACRIGSEYVATVLMDEPHRKVREVNKIDQFSGSLESPGARRTSIRKITPTEVPHNQMPLLDLENTLLRQKILNQLHEINKHSPNSNESTKPTSLVKYVINV